SPGGILDDLGGRWVRVADGVEEGPWHVELLQASLHIRSVEVRRDAPRVPEAAPRPGRVDRGVGEQVAVVHELLEHHALADHRETEAGTERHDAEGGVRTTGAEPELLAGQG